MKLTDRTYVIYATDNGPWLPFRHHGGSAGPLRNGKGTTFEGGQRVPCLIRGPGIPAGTVCSELTGTIDVLPTIAALTETKLPDDRKIDGMDVSGLWNGTDEQSPRNEFLYYTSQGKIEGIRRGDWKLLVKNGRAQKGQGNNRKSAEPEVFLFNLIEDLGEQNNLAAKHPEKVDELRDAMEKMDQRIGEEARLPWTTE